MKKLTSILSQEHLVVLDVLNRLERAVEEKGDGPLRDVLRFFDEELGLHRRKEEEILFPELRTLFPPEEGPVRCMLMEHQQEKQLLSALRFAMGRRDRDEIRKTGLAVVQHLRDHIWKEDNVLFPMAEQVLGGEALARVRTGFECIGSFCGGAAAPSGAVGKGKA